MVRVRVFPEMALAVTQTDSEVKWKSFSETSVKLVIDLGQKK